MGKSQTCLPMWCDCPVRSLFCLRSPANQLLDADHLHALPSAASVAHHPLCCMQLLIAQ